MVRLHQLVERAQRRLSCEPASDKVDRVMARLRELTVAVRRAPAERALALFASDSRAEAVHLGVMVDDRVVVDPTFATRDLVRAVQANPPYRILVLCERRARLLEGCPTGMREITTGGFPVSAGQVADRSDRSRRFGREPSDRRDSVLRAQMRAIDVALGARHADEPLPLVVAGVSRQLALFGATSMAATSTVGEIRGSHSRTPAAVLERLARPIIEHHREVLCLTALVRLDGARERARLVEGIDAVWVAAVDGRIGLLCVEENFTFPSRVAADGRRLVPATDVEHPEVLDDSIDEVIGLVSATGGEIAIVENGVLASRQRIAALLIE